MNLCGRQKRGLFCSVWTFARIKVGFPVGRIKAWLLLPHPLLLLFSLYWQLPIIFTNSAAMFLSLHAECLKLNLFQRINVFILIPTVVNSSPERGLGIVAEPKAKYNEGEIVVRLKLSSMQNAAAQSRLSSGKIQSNLHSSLQQHLAYWALSLFCHIRSIFRPFTTTCGVQCLQHKHASHNRLLQTQFICCLPKQLKKPSSLQKLSNCPFWTEQLIE